MSPRSENLSAVQIEDFSDDEIAALRSADIVLFADRVIYDARPPMSAGRIAEVQALCAGELPRGLVELWRLTAGGRLDYDLSLPMAGRQEAVSWCELFYDGSDRYHDLAGWIEHELESAREAAEARGEAWSGLLDAVPLGGFEYCDRIYVVTGSGRYQAGTVVAWKMGLPPAWTGAMHEDGVAVVGADVFAAFQALHFEADPLDPVQPGDMRREFLDYLDDHIGDGGLSPELADKLLGFYRQAMLDWRTPLADGTLASRPDVARVAMTHAIERDDADLLRSLITVGVDLGLTLRGGDDALGQAMRGHAYAAASALVAAGAPVASEALDTIKGTVPPTLTAALLAGGAEPSAEAMALCVAYGAADSARLIGAALDARGVDAATAYAAASADLLKEREDCLERMRGGRYRHYLGLDGLAEHAQRLREFVAA